MEQGLEELNAWFAAAERYISSNPANVVLVGEALIAIILILLLLLVRSSRRFAELKTAKEALPQHGAGELVKEAVKEAQLEKDIEEYETFNPLVGEPSTIAGEAFESAQPVEVPDVVVAEPPVQVPRESAISVGLQKSRVGLLGRLAGLFSGRNAINEDMLDDLEEVLILGDVGARCASALVQEVKDLCNHRQGEVSRSAVIDLLKGGILSRLIDVPSNHRLYAPAQSPLVVLVVGVNGVGKTTTVAKLATKYMEQGKKVLVIAADTFRAAAVEQLAEWSNRVGFALSRGPEGAKPSAVVFDGMVRANAEGFDVVLIDTAGRLHTKSNLMQELEGVRNSIRRHVADAPHETVLVLDGISGQNALSQAREFNQAIQLTGLVVTKLDGTPKGGIIVAISDELKLPVFYIGVGEKVGDLLAFERESFVDALFDEQLSNASIDERAVINQ